CYHTAGTADDVTQRLRSLAGAWRDVHSMADDELAALVRRDRIDLLVDLAGHTRHHRLLAFARRPAPVQLTWLGYLNTTGMAAMDWRITDPVADPAGEPELLHRERLLRLPASQ